MTEPNIKKKSFCIVCIANYCRSPVFESILKKRFGNKFEFFSVGLSPMPKANMDPRSLEFLSQIGIKDVIHNPKKINKKVLSYFDYFLAVDLFVLNALNRTYPKYMKKFKLVNAQFPNIDIIDPYTFKEEDYIDVLLKIEHISQNIDLEKY